MRINVYSEELTERVELREKTAGNTGAHFFGLHFYLLSPGKLHHDEKDDDTSAVILWSDSRERLLALLNKAIEEVRKPIPATSRDLPHYPVD